MRKLTLFGCLAVGLLVGFAASAFPVVFGTGTQYELTNCSDGGNSSTTVASGSYVLTVTDGDTRLCAASTCDAGVATGVKLPQGTLILMSVAGDTAYSCQSYMSTGDVHFAPAQ